MAVRVTGYTGGSTLSVRGAAVFSAMIKKYLMEVNTPLWSKITGHYTKPIADIRYSPFIPQSVLLQVHSLFQSEFCT
jgi:hypothetical protein